MYFCCRDDLLDVLLRLQINRDGNHQKRNHRRESSTDQEIKLPQEWIYWNDSRVMEFYENEDICKLE